MRKRDVWVVAGLLVAAGALYLLRGAFMPDTRAADTVRVYVAGALYTQCPLSPGEAITVTQADGRVNTVRMTEDGFFMEFSTCANQLCVLEGVVTGVNARHRALGAHVICLPHQVDVELMTALPTPTPLPGAPDV